MGFASVTAGRMALNFGSGRILGDNDWVQNEGNTWDGFLVGINNDFADLHVGYAATDMTDAYEATTMYANVGKEMGAAALNLYMLTVRKMFLALKVLQWVLMQHMQWTTESTYLLATILLMMVITKWI